MGPAAPEKETLSFRLNFSGNEKTLLLDAGDRAAYGADPGN